MSEAAAAVAVAVPAKRCRCGIEPELRITLGAEQIYPLPERALSAHRRDSGNLIHRMSRTAALDVLKALDPGFEGLSDDEMPNLRLFASVHESHVTVTLASPAGQLLNLDVQMHAYRASVLWKSRPLVIQRGSEHVAAWAQRRKSIEGLTDVWEIAARVLDCTPADRKLLDTVDRSITGGCARIYEE
jgi:hypothetical protein